MGKMKPVTREWEGYVQHRTAKKLVDSEQWDPDEDVNWFPDIVKDALFDMADTKKAFAAGDRSHCQRVKVTITVGG